MGVRRPWTWAVMGAAVVAAALAIGAGPATGVHRFAAADAATLSHAASWPGALQAVLRPDGHRLDSAGDAAASSIPLLPVLASLLGALALPSRGPRRRHTQLHRRPASRNRQQLQLGRAPPIPRVA